jgi:hypothetical protein
VVAYPEHQGQFYHLYFQKRQPIRALSTKYESFDRFENFVTAYVRKQVSWIGPSSSLQSLPDAKASRNVPRLAEWNNTGHQTVHISSKVL